MSSQKKVNSWARRGLHRIVVAIRLDSQPGSKRGPLNDSKTSSKCGQNNTVEDCEGADGQTENALQIALRYFEKVRDCFPCVRPVPVKNSRLFW